MQACLAHKITGLSNLTPICHEILQGAVRLTSLTKRIIFTKFTFEFQAKYKFCLKKTGLRDGRAHLAHKQMDSPS